MPPAPSGPRTSYGPRRVPAARVTTALDLPDGLSLSLPPVSAHIRYRETPRIPVDRERIEPSVRRQTHSHGPGPELEKAGHVGRGQLFPSLSLSRGQLDAVHRQGLLLGASNENRLAVRAPLDEEVARLGSVERARTALAVGALDQLQAVHGRAGGR